MSAEISVITCAHNPRPDHLMLVLNALRKQTLDHRRWEYLLVDNASDQALNLHAELSWHPHGRLIREERLGLTPARLRGIQESTGDLLVFVDDDNVLDPDYLEQVIRLAGSWPEIGAFSGQVRPQFEEPPAEWTRKYWNRLAIREFNHDRWSNIPSLDETTPNGAGLCVRRQVALLYFSHHANGKRKVVLDRTGEDLLSAGDLDLATTACDLGLGNALFASLKLTHLLPRERLDEDYLLRLMEAQTFSAVVLDSFRSHGQAPPCTSWRSAVADRLRLARMDGRDRRFVLAARAGQRKALRFLADGS
jgi:glycosyltransferase involved in cell wall biosynthesis